MTRRSCTAPASTNFFTSSQPYAALPFVFISVDSLDIEENTYFAIIDNEEFKKIKNKGNIIDKIVDDYKRERV